MVNIPIEKTALVVVDMQKAFMSADAVGIHGEPLEPPAKIALPGCLRAIDAAREAGVPVIYTKYVYHRGRRDFGRIHNELVRSRSESDVLVEGSPEVELLDEIEPSEDEIVIDKSRPSAFYGTRLEPVLTSMGIENLVFCGVTTNVCVESSARDASQRDYGTYVVSDATGEFTRARHEHSLYAIEWIFGEVCSVEDLTESWSENRNENTVTAHTSDREGAN